jgi:hypothetical protein
MGKSPSLKVDKAPQDSHLKLLSRPYYGRWCPCSIERGEGHTPDSDPHA